jgi:hypothetical protein
MCRLVFLLGETDDKEDQSKLEQEAQQYGDVVQVRILTYCTVSNKRVGHPIQLAHQIETDFS